MLSEAEERLGDLTRGRRGEWFKKEEGNGEEGLGDLARGRRGEWFKKEEGNGETMKGRRRTWRLDVRETGRVVKKETISEKTGTLNSEV